MDMPHPFPPPLPRFQFRPDKAAEAIEIVAREKPGLTQYFVGKILYLADKAHFIDWGRPVTFDRYVAMKHGPVPSSIRNMLAAAAGTNAGMDPTRFANATDHAAQLAKLVRVELEIRLNGERQHVYPMMPEREPRWLSGSDIDAILGAIQAAGASDFGQLRSETHKDEAWREAWYDRAHGRVAEIDISLWVHPTDRDAVRLSLEEFGAYSYSR